MTRYLSRTTTGTFLRDGDKTYSLGDVSTDKLSEAILTAQAEGTRTGTLLAPIAPTQIFIVGLNYPSHAKEVGQPIPGSPMLAPTSGDCATHSGAIVTRPADFPDFVDYEGEIGIVIAKHCHKVSAENALDYVLGLTACIDLGQRDQQFRAIMAMRAGKDGPSLTASKTFPGSKPLGPEIILLDGADPATLDLPLTTHVNGELRQTGHISELIFDVARLVSEASHLDPMKAGDVISSGTPAGIGLVDGIFLEAGDIVSVTLGELAPLTITIA
jgi:2-keto-4-pentenoate hydratase/2-oxohepta-3-ene-1,7-dioic acid hydratase in catechol pathway